MIEVWWRGRIARITVGEASLDVDQDDLPELIDELSANAKGQWNRAELDRLVELCHEGKKPAQIARIIGRDGKSTNAKIFQLRRKGAL